MPRVTVMRSNPLFNVGDHVELSPALDLWMRGARFGSVTRVGKRGGFVWVKLDRLPGRARKFKETDLSLVTPAWEFEKQNPRDRSVSYPYHIVYDRVLATDGKSWREVHHTPTAWKTRQYGKPTEQNLMRFIQAFESSTTPGGPNAHLGITQVSAARLVRASDGKVMASWHPAPFGVMAHAPRRNPAARDPFNAIDSRPNPARRVRVKRNPAATRVSAVLSTRVLDLSYEHSEKGRASYRHKFARGVSCQLLSDGSVRLFRPDRKPIWKAFSDR